MGELEKYLMLEETVHRTRLENQEIHWRKTDSGAALSCRQNLHPLLVDLPLHRPRPNFRLEYSPWCYVRLRRNQSACVHNGFSVLSPCITLMRSKKLMAYARCVPPLHDRDPLPPVEWSRYPDHHSLQLRKHLGGDSIPFPPH